MHFAQEQHLFTGSFDRRVGVWDMTKTLKETKHCGWLWGPPGKVVTAVLYIPKYKQVATGYDNGMLILWDAQFGSMWHGWDAHSLPVVDLAFDADRCILISAAASKVKHWSFPSNYGPTGGVSTGDISDSLNVGLEDSMAGVGLEDGWQAADAPDK